MKKRNQTAYGLLLSAYHREAGSANIEGKDVSWEAGEFIRVIPEGNEYGNVKKYQIHSAYIKDVSSAVDQMEWGQFVRLTLDGKQVVGVEQALLEEEITL